MVGEGENNENTQYGEGIYLFGIVSDVFRIDRLVDLEFCWRDSVFRRSRVRDLRSNQEGLV